MSEHTKCNKQTSCEKCHCSGCLLHQAEEPKLGEECGVFGMYDMEGRDVASTIYYGLFSLQQDRRAAVLQSAVRTVLHAIPLRSREWDLSMRYSMRKTSAR